MQICGGGGGGGYAFSLIKLQNSDLLSYRDEIKLNKYNTFNVSCKISRDCYYTIPDIK